LKAKLRNEKLAAQQAQEAAELKAREEKLTAGKGEILRP